VASEPRCRVFDRRAVGSRGRGRCSRRNRWALCGRCVWPLPIKRIEHLRFRSKPHRRTVRGGNDSRHAYGHCGSRRRRALRRVRMPMRGRQPRGRIGRWHSPGECTPSFASVPSVPQWLGALSVGRPIPKCGWTQGSSNTLHSGISTPTGTHPRLAPRAWRRIFRSASAATC
jgi:hypothetical protein